MEARVLVLANARVYALHRAAVQAAWSPKAEVPVGIEPTPAVRSARGRNGHIALGTTIALVRVLDGASATRRDQRGTDQERNLTTHQIRLPAERSARTKAKR